jgi:acetolactate synthase I/II/III large subunit
MTDVTCGILLAHLLKAHGVDTVFGIPGVHNVEVYRGLHQTGIRHISPRHEQGAGFMADGYARASGKPGVAFVITGPGLTNIVTAMGQAYADSMPMLVVSTVNRRHELGFGRGFLHEMPNQQALAAGVSAFSHRLQRADELPEVLAAAFAVFESGRPRPVNLEIPIDVIEQKVALPSEVRRRAVLARPAPAPDGIAAAVAALSKAKRVMIIAGGGAVGAAAEIQQLAERLQAPVQLTVNGRGLLPSGHPLLGDWTMSYMDGRAVMNSADAVLAIGTEFGETDYGFYAPEPFAVRTAPGSQGLIRIDIDPRQIAVGPAPTIGLVGDARLAVSALNTGLAAGPARQADAAWTSQSLAAIAKIGHRSREPEDSTYDALLTTIKEAAADPILVGDSTKPAYRAQLRYRSGSPRSLFCAGTGFGTLGFALPAAIGAKLAMPGRAVIVLAGDGGLQFTLSELASAREAGAGIAVIVWNNHGYREIKDFMVAKEIAPIGVDPPPPDFVRVAEAMGIPALRPTTIAAVADALRNHGPKAKLPLLLELDATTFTTAP